MLKTLWPTFRMASISLGAWSLVVVLFPLALIYDAVGRLDPALMSMPQLEAFSSAMGAALAAWYMVCGILVTLGVWTPDEQGRHIYALTLPVSRGHYVMLRLAMGAVALTAVSAVAAAATIALGAWMSPPAPLRVYSVAVSARGWLTALVTFAFVSALWVNDPFGKLNRALNRRAPVLVVAAVWVAIVAGGGWLFLLSDTAIGHATRAALVHDWSPLRLVVANWNLFDG